MDDPTFMGVPFFSRRYGEAVELALGIRELDSVARFKVAASYIR